MIISEEINRVKLQSIIVGELKKAGLKHRLKKIILKNIKDNKTVFGAALNKVPSCSVVCCGSTLNVPIVVTEMAAVLRNNSHIEGLFRKAGSQSRQRDIKRLVEAGGCVSAGHHPVDVAGVLKLFLRALPEPLIPAEVQELLLRCNSPGEDALSVFHTLLLLPVLHVHLLHYIMELLQYIASRHRENRMDAANLAIVLAPSVMPLPAAATAQRAQRHVTLVQLLIERAPEVGALSAGLQARLCDGKVEGDAHGEGRGDAATRKKRRSGSLNRVLSGLRRMVAGGASLATGGGGGGGVTPALRRPTAAPPRGGLSAKAREEIRSSLPQKELIFTPMKMGQSERKRLRLSMVEPFPPRRSAAPSPVDLSPEYVRVSRHEYEAIKSRVCAIERRLSQELADTPPKPDSPPHGPAQVQRAYTHTLQEAFALQPYDPLPPRRPVTRSPSARKIGSIRRRSKENVPRLSRQHSCHVRPSPADQAVPDIHLPSPDYRYARRTRTSLGATPHSDDTRSTVDDRSRYSSNTTADMNRTRSTLGDRSRNSTADVEHTRSTVDGWSRQSTASDMSWEVSQAEEQPVWRSAAAFFMERTGELSAGGGSAGGRPSVNKLRRQNAGAVRAKTKMFESSSDLSSERHEPRPPLLARRAGPRTKPDVKSWGAARPATRKPPGNDRSPLALSPRRRSPRQKLQRAVPNT